MSLQSPPVDRMRHFRFYSVRWTVELTLYPPPVPLPCAPPTPQRVVTGLPSGARSHAFLTVDSTLVSLYSGRQVTELSPAAVLSLLLLVHAVIPPAEEEEVEAGETGG